MKRCLILVMALTLLVSFFPFASCGEQTCKEKQIIEMTYRYLISKADQLQGVHSKAIKSQITWRFQSAVLEATRVITLSDDKLGNPIKMQFSETATGLPESETPTLTGALKKLAKRTGEGLWAVSIVDWEWEFDERTSEVKAKNSEAVKLLGEISVRTYNNTKYGYSINYPPGWNILDAIQEAVSISFVSADGTMEAAIFLFYLPKVPNLGLRYYAEQRIASFHPDSYQIQTAEGNREVSGIVADIIGLRFDYMGGKINYGAKWYFIERDEKIFEILTVSRSVAIEGMTNLFDPYSSLQFQP
jgi:hypothetical protein